MTVTLTHPPLTLTFTQITNLEQPLIALSRIEGLPSKTAFRLARLITKLGPEVENYNKHREKLIRKYGVPVGDGSENMTVAADKMAEFQPELDGLLKETVTINSWKPFVESDFYAKDGNLHEKISSLLLCSMMPFFNEDAFDDDMEIKSSVASITSEEVLATKSIVNPLITPNSTGTVSEEPLAVASA